jgi:hypothetical protein
MASTSCTADPAELAAVSRLTDFAEVNAAAHAVGTAFLESAVAGRADRAALGARALAYLRRQRMLRPATGEDAIAEVRNLLTISAMCGWRRTALQYARQLERLPACTADDGCFCTAAGQTINLLRSETNSSAAESHFAEVAKTRCPYATSWQMPTPLHGYQTGLRALPFWNPDSFAAGRLLRQKGPSLLRELRPFVRRRSGGSEDGSSELQPSPSSLWSRDTDSVAYELIEAGLWRQITLFDAQHGWNASICTDLLQRTCATLKAFAATADGKREFGGKVKLFELGPGASLLPHFGPSNRRLFLHMAVVLPAANASASLLRVAEETRRWGSPGELQVFDDSFEHSVKNQAGNGIRVVLGVELNHPDIVRLRSSVKALRC